MTEPTTTAGAGMLPGRAVDIVLAAAARADVEVSSLHLSWIVRHLTVYVWGPDRGPSTPQLAYAVLARLGVGADATVLNRPAGRNHATVEADVEILGGLRLIVVIDAVPDAPEPVDPGELVAEVDAARAAQEAAAPLVDAPPAAPAAPSMSSTSMSGVGERAARFEARFDSVCPACRQALLEGTAASWLDGEVVHDHCATAAGVEVYDR